MHSTSPLSSVGERCVKQGFSFVWPAGRQPCFITPWLTRVPLAVEDNIPYLHIGSSECEPEPIRPEHLCVPMPSTSCTPTAHAVAPAGGSVTPRSRKCIEQLASEISGVTPRSREHRNTFCRRSRPTTLIRLLFPPGFSRTTACIAPRTVGGKLAGGCFEKSAPKLTRRRLVT